MLRDGHARILLIDDDDDSRALMARSLRAAGHHVVESADGAEVDPEGYVRFDLVLTDLQMPQVGGRAVLAAARRQSPSTPVVVFTAYAEAQGALDLIAEGAYDYLPRPVDLGRLKLLVQRALEWRNLSLENVALRQRAAPSPSNAPKDPLLVGTSAAMLDVYRVIVQVAPTSAPVLVLGEVGSGRELVAKTIHARSGRSGPFVAMSCAAHGDAALAAELFGDDQRAGLVEQADGGTLFLDDVDAIGPKLQAQLLKAIEDRAVRRNGTAQRVDVRLVTATGQDLVAESAAGRFREDLLFRLQVVTVQVPPLSARREDLPALIDHFLQHYAAALGKPAPTLAAEARAQLMEHPWPGNVRELAQTLERAVLLARGAVILRDDLPPTVRQRPARGPAAELPEQEWPTLATVERRYIDRVLEYTGGNKTRAAEVLGIDRRTLSRLFARERASTGEADTDALEN